MLKTSRSSNLSTKRNNCPPDIITKCSTLNMLAKHPAHNKAEEMLNTPDADLLALPCSLQPINII